VGKGTFLFWRVEMWGREGTFLFWRVEHAVGGTILVPKLVRSSATFMVRHDSKIQKWAMTKPALDNGAIQEHESPPHHFHSFTAPDNWERDSITVLERFYTGEEYVEAVAELHRVVAQSGGGRWSDDVAEYQDRINKHVPQQSGKYHVQTMADMQLFADKFAPHRLWGLFYKSEFPRLHQVAMRLLTMGVQSADVERSCKVHKIVKTKYRNRQTLKTVMQLMYCYINLRLLKKQEDKLDDNDALEDFLEQAILVNNEVDSEGEESVVEIVE
jgi:hAT family C-terminal dimerisation region